MINVFKVKLKYKIDSSYDIVIGENLDKNIINDLKRFNHSKYIIVTDDVTRKLFGDKLLAVLKKNKINSDIVSFTAGEKNKNIATVTEICRELLRKGTDRKSCIVALGGGVAGDIAGFVASIFMRGIEFVQIPTTLLAMVDSSIGGKVGVDLDAGKNILGMFAQPKRVYIDIDYLKTLPIEELENGLAEIIKHGIIADKKLFIYIEKNLDKIFRKDVIALTKIIIDSVKIKKAIVEKDEKESLLRMKLNFGHTTGHAVEALSNYRIKHGKGVALGMLIESRIANKLGLLKNVDMLRINLLVRRAGLNIHDDVFKAVSKANLNKLVLLMHHDKKAFKGDIRFILPLALGKVVIRSSLKDNLIKESVLDVLPRG
ncbi:TPA: 3-dehydroquinate synthase [Candidatus Woesearchaeota archaeon]|nr:3-dehydroquinate synthase [Candidatus Woesearchaeota archaeon]